MRIPSRKTLLRVAAGAIVGAVAVAALWSPAKRMMGERIAPGAAYCAAGANDRLAFRELSPAAAGYVRDHCPFLVPER